MIATFWIVSGMLALVVVLFLLRPLLQRKRQVEMLSRNEINTAVYRQQLLELNQDLVAGTLSQSGHKEALRELESRVLEDIPEDSISAQVARQRAPKTAVVIGVALPVLAVALYLAVGNLQIMIPAEDARSAEQSPHGVQEEQIQAMVDRLAERMRREPDNIDGWIMLGRSYGALGKFDEAARAYANAVARRDSDAVLLADFADALAMAQGRSMQGEPEKIVMRALAIDPNNLKALALAGTATFEREDYTGAIRYWERMLEIAPMDSELAQSVRGSIVEARALGAKSASPVTDATDKPAQRPIASSISGVVMLSPELANRVAPTDTLFVYARAVVGSRMPLAIVRAQVRDLPYRFTLDDSLAMAPGMHLSTHKQVVIGARISKSGSAAPQAGDLQEVTDPVAVGTRDVTVLIRTETR
jgi:cytochrome c-type biogenesis protein CcmH